MPLAQASGGGAAAEPRLILFNQFQPDIHAGAAHFAYTGNSDHVSKEVIEILENAAGYARALLDAPQRQCLLRKPDQGQPFLLADSQYVHLISTQINCDADRFSCINSLLWSAAAAAATSTTADIVLIGSRP